MTLSKSLLAASALALIVASGSAKAADVAPTSDCYLAGDGWLGLMHNNQTVTVSDEDDSEELDVNWLTPFAEGRGLISCGAFNFQGDFAYYNHMTDDISLGKDGPSLSLDTANAHFGGAAFWRDQNVGMLGVTGSWITQDILFKDADYLRAGLVGEFFLNDQLTIGMSAHLFGGDIGGKDISHDGFELAANLKYYATPDFSLKLEGALLGGELESDDDDESIDLDGYSIGMQAEYLAWHQGLSLFAGGRYSRRELSSDESDTAFDIDDFQVFAGVKIAFGGNTESLVSRDRSGPIDQTSIFLEKLPNAISSVTAAAASAAEDEPDIVLE